MKLWLIFVLFGQVAVAWGPLPNDRAKCEAFVAEMVEEVIDGLPHNPEVRINGRLVTADDIEAYCVLADRRPARGSIFSQDS